MLRIRNRSRVNNWTWTTDGPTFLLGAMRRTEEGGRNLREDYWATKPEPAPDEKAKIEAEEDGEEGITAAPIEGTKLPAQ
jgi:hypothetical protein